MIGVGRIWGLDQLSTRAADRSCRATTGPDAYRRVSSRHDLNLDEGWLRVSKQLGRDGTLRRLKTNAGRRAVPLPRVMFELLTRHRTEQEKLRADAATGRTTVWCSRPARGRPVSQRNADRSWTRILERAGVQHRGIHRMWHTWITALAEQGVHERTTQQLAGHADGRMTREIYTHVTDKMLRRRPTPSNAVDDTDTNGSSSGSNEGDEAGNDEDQEPEDGA